jgi:hypothetical protein
MQESSNNWVCPECDNLNEYGYVRCLSCGFELSCESKASHGNKSYTQKETRSLPPENNKDDQDNKKWYYSQLGWSQLKGYETVYKGPFSTKQISLLYNTAKIISSSYISENENGPWIPLDRSSIFETLKKYKLEHLKATETRKRKASEINSSQGQQSSLNDNSTYYQILGLKSFVSKEEIKQAYKDLLNVWNPDRFLNEPSLQQKAQQKIKEIDEAYEKLILHMAADISKPTQVSSGVKTSKTSFNSNTTERDNSSTQLKAAIGEKNTDYYFTKFEEFDQQGSGLKASWNWPAFFCSGVWALYRKMYIWFFVFWGIAITGNMIEKSGYSVLGTLISLAPFIAFPIFANSLYHGTLKKKIAKAKSSINNEAMLIEYLRHKGGVHNWVAWVFGLILPIGIIAVILIVALGNNPSTEESEPRDLIKEYNIDPNTFQSK